MEKELTHVAGVERGSSRYVFISLAFLLLHAVFMFYRGGQLPIAPAVPDEVIINDAAISLSRGQGYVAASLMDSKFGLDHMFAHFPPLYPYAESLAFRTMGISAFSLRFTTVVMSIGSTFVLAFLLYGLCRRGWLDWSVALLINALFDTNASLIALERMARMESMISLLMMLSLGSILYAATQPAGRTGKRWALLPMLAAGFLGALCMGVHPEAITALILLGILLLFLVPASRSAKWLSLALFLLVPVIIGFIAFGTHILDAVRQFLAIAQGAMHVNPTSREWFNEAIHNHDLSRLNRNTYLMSIMLLLLIAPVIYATVTRKLPRTSLRYRMGACMAVIGVVEVLLMVFGLQMDDRRCQFLFGPLLVCDAFCLFGPAALRSWHKWLGYTLVALNCCVVLYYLSARGDRAPDMNPNRYVDLIQHLPAGETIAATPGLWLDLQEQKRPFALILYGLDGEAAWGEKDVNPLARFDVVILERYYAVYNPLWRLQAEQGRTRHSYRVGSVDVDVYIRDSAPGTATLKPAL